MDFETLTKININYLTYLDYVEIRILGKVSKRFNSIHQNNEILRQILCLTIDDLQLQPDTDIVTVMIELHNNIMVMVNKNYPPDMFFPKFINKELFFIILLKDIYGEILEEFRNFIYIDEEINFHDLFNDFQINKQVIAFSFVAETAWENNITDKHLYRVDSKIKIPKSFIDYIKYPLLQCYRKGDEIFWNSFYSLIKNLLFIR